MSDATLEVMEATAESPEALELRRHLDDDLRGRYPGGPIHGFDAADIADGSGVFVLARLGGRAVGCGALRKLDMGVGEVKRIYVEPASRGRGAARAILRFLEQKAPALGFHTLRLETGTRQPESIRLYETSGYHRIEPYGEYIGDLHSVCFEKRLTKA